VGGVPQLDHRGAFGGDALHRAGLRATAYTDFRYGFRFKSAYLALACCRRRFRW
jgi:hypothetical protein